MPGTASEAGVDAVAAVALCMGFGVHGYETRRMDEMSRLGRNPSHDEWGRLHERNNSEAYETKSLMMDDGWGM